MRIADLVVLLIEPSGIQARIIREQLENLGVLDIDLAESRETAAALIETSKPDLVISAMYLPDGTGTELVEWMHTTEGYRDIPFMLISSETSIRALEPIRQAGSIAILPKPFEIEQLQQALHSTVDLLEPDAINIPEVEPENLKVMLVDDSVTSRHQIGRLLTGMGFSQLIEAKDGVEAVELLKGQHFDLIVTDYNMPHMDGKELVEYIRHESNQTLVPIMLVTSEHNQSRLAAIQNAGVSAVCDKPFEPSSIKSALEGILSTI
jgi:two-component system, chemotaxis family, chemotaxis protein CheY